VNQLLWGGEACADSRRRGREQNAAHPQAKLCPRCSFSYTIGLIVHLQRVQVYWCRINLPVFVTVEICRWWGIYFATRFNVSPYLAKSHNPPRDTILSPLCPYLKSEIHFDCIQPYPRSSKWLFSKVFLHQNVVCISCLRVQPHSHCIVGSSPCDV